MKKRSLVSIILVVASLGMMLVGCGKSKEVTNKEAKTDKSLTMAIAAETDLLAPLYMGSNNMSTTMLVYENLVNYENGKIVPGLAKSWEFSNEGKTLTFHLQEGVSFHDGEPFNAEAVKANLLHKQSNPSFYTLKAVTNIESMEVKDELTLVINYPQPYFAYLNDFCWNDVMPMVSPKVLVEGDYQTVIDVVGTGPYIREEIVAGQYSRFVPNEDYWGEKPYYEEVIVKYIPDSSSRIQALKTGEIDMIFGSALLSYEDYQQAISISGIKGMISEMPTRARDITLNAKRPYLNDLKVRQAIAYAIDKNEISQGLTYGYEAPANLMFTPDSPYFDLPLNHDYSFNIEKANALLDEAGWKLNEKTGIREKDEQILTLKLTLDTGFDSLNQSLASLLQTQLQRVGIEVTIKGLEQMEWYSGFMAGDFDITIWQPQYNYSAPHCWFTPMDYSTPQTVSLQGLSDSTDFIAAIQEITKTDNTKRLTELFTYLYNYNLGNVIDIPLTYSMDMIVYNEDKIKGYDFVGTPCFFDITNMKPVE